MLIIISGYQHIRMYDLNVSNPNPIINYDGISKNITAVGFHEEGKWMYTGGEDNSAKIWDLRSDVFIYDSMSNSDICDEIKFLKFGLS
jgi:G protein beta subunit-like protein